jgi:hypothetical protein
MSYNVPVFLFLIDLSKGQVGGIRWYSVTNQGLLSEPENVKADDKSISGILHMKDGSSYEFIYDLTSGKTQYALLNPVNPQPEPEVPVVETPVS